MIEKLSKYILLTWVLINLLMLPVAVFAEEPAILSQNIDSNKIALAQFGKVVPISYSTNANDIIYSSTAAENNPIFRHLSNNIILALVLILYAIIGIVFYGVYSHGLKIGLSRRAALDMSVISLISIVAIVAVVGIVFMFIGKGNGLSNSYYDSTNFNNEEQISSFDESEEASQDLAGQVI